MCDTPVIEIYEATKRYTSSTSRPPAVDTVSLDVWKSEFLVILGESGSGKTTLLKAINRLTPLTAGQITVEGKDIAKGPPARLRRRIGYAFQGVGLFPHMSVAANVAITPRLLKWDAIEVTRRVNELLEMVGLPPREFRDRRPAELSGGQRQRVGVARALAAAPGIMLLDEPFGALDLLTRDELQREYRAIHDRLGLTTVMVTHDMNEALLMADRIGVMKDGQLLQLGTPHELLAEPADAYVQRLMSKPREQADRVEAMLAGEATTKPARFGAPPQAGPERSEGPGHAPAVEKGDPDLRFAQDRLRQKQQRDAKARTDDTLSIEDEPESDTGAPPA
ncbi:MAG: ATP-binding cassette domain-containing protein [Phycisphaeraceae bacterium]